MPADNCETGCGFSADQSERRIRGLHKDAKCHKESTACTLKKAWLVCLIIRVKEVWLLCLNNSMTIKEAFPVTCDLELGRCVLCAWELLRRWCCLCACRI